MKNMIQKIKNAIRASLTYNVVYAPEKSENEEAIQVYKVIGHPSLHAWRTSKGDKVFTAPVRNRDENFRCFRADRVLGVTWAAF